MRRSPGERSTCPSHFHLRRLIAVIISNVWVRRLASMSIRNHELNENGQAFRLFATLREGLVGPWQHKVGLDRLRPASLKRDAMEGAFRSKVRTLCRWSSLSLVEHATLDMNVEMARRRGFRTKANRFTDGELRRRRCLDLSSWKSRAALPYLRLRQRSDPTS